MNRSVNRTWQVVSSGICLIVLALLVPHPIDAQNKVMAIYTFPDIPIKSFQDTFFPGTVANDRNVLLGSVGSDLWRGPNDAPGEFWMLTDRGPNGLINVDGKNRRTFWVPEFDPVILRVKVEDKAIRILERIPIVDQSGKPVTGLPNLRNVDETPYDYSGQRELSFNVNGIDPEGL